MGNSIPDFDDLRHYIIMLKDSKNVTVQAIADNTGIPKSTLDGYFSGNVKDPKFLYTGSVIKYLGGSVDEFLGIDRIHEKEYVQIPVSDPSSVKKEYITELLDRIDIKHNDTVKAYTEEVDMLRKVAKHEHKEKTIRDWIIVFLLIANIVLLLLR